MIPQILLTLDGDTRTKISALIYETVVAAPGTYEIPAICKIIESKSIWNAKTIHYMVDDQLDFGSLYLDKYNRLCTTNHPMPSPRPTRTTHGADQRNAIWTSTNPPGTRF